MANTVVIASRFCRLPSATRPRSLKEKQPSGQRRNRVRRYHFFPYTADMSSRFHVCSSYRTENGAIDTIEHETVIDTEPRLS